MKKDHLLIIRFSALGDVAMLVPVVAAGTAVVQVNRLLLAATLKEVAAVLVMY